MSRAPAAAGREARNRTLVENLNVLVYRAEPATLRTTYVNRVVEELYGYSAEEWLRDPALWEKRLHPHDRESVRAQVAEALAARGEGRIEYRIVRRDGAVRWVIDSFSLEHDDAGAPLALNGVMADVTERRLAADRLAESGQAKSAFLAAISHELKTPLNAILGYCELLCDAVPADGPGRDYADEIRASGQRLLELLNNLVDFVRLESGAEALQREPTDIAQLLADAAAAQRAMARRHGIAFALDVAAAGEARVDARRLRQLVAQLLSNAVKFTPSGGRVALRAAPAARGGALEIAVEDSGIGIAPADRAKLFRPFVQLDSALSRKAGGIGLGLALARRIAELHGGAIDVVSEPGRGSVFTVRLPLDIEEASP